MSKGGGCEGEGGGERGGRREGQVGARKGPQPLLQ